MQKSNLAGGKDSFWALILVLLWFSLLFASCKGPERSAAAPLRIGMMDAPETLDPHKRNAFGTSNIIGQMYESLVSYDRNLGLMPGLAESWENPEENRWRFHLRKDVHFHNGKLMDAYDVEASFQRLRSDKTLENGSYISHVTEVKVLGPRAIEITTSRLSISTLHRLLYVYIIPKDHSGCDNRWNEVSCGTGPYQLVSWRGKKVELQRNEHYWKRKRVYDRVEYTFYDQSSDLLNALSSVPLDVAKLDGSPIPSEVSRDFRIESLESLYVAYLGINMGLQDMLLGGSLEMRDLLSEALDRQRIVDESRYGHATITLQVVPPYVYGFDPSVKLASFRKIHPAFPPHREMRFLVRQLMAPVGYAMQRQFEELGLRTKMTVLPDAEFFQETRAGNFDLFISRWGCITTDASELFENCFYRRGMREGYGVTNYTRYGSPELDEEIEKSGLSLDPHERIKMLQKVLRRVSMDLPWIPLYINHDVYAIRPGIQWQPRLDSRVNAWEFVRGE